MRQRSFALAVAVAGAITMTAFARGTGQYEVWAIDQSNSPGVAFGGTLYIWDGHDLESRGAAAEPAAKIDLSGAAAALCVARTGAYPVATSMNSTCPVATKETIACVCAAFMAIMCGRTVDGSGVERADVHALAVRTK